MNVAKEQGLISPGIPTRGGRWADLGSGTGIFTLALSNLIGPEGQVYSVDKDRAALSAQESMFRRISQHATLELLMDDFTKSLPLPPLDGILMANSLHFIETKDRVLGLVMSYLKRGGRLIIVEYNANVGNHWVPYPIDFPSRKRLAERLGFADCRLLATVPSRFLGEMYSCLCIRGPEWGASKGHRQKALVDNHSGWTLLLWTCRVSCLQPRSTRAAGKNCELLTEGRFSRMRYCRERRVALRAE
jgi:SAM-dependent methyltransferase